MKLLFKMELLPSKFSLLVYVKLKRVMYNFVYRSTNLQSSREFWTALIRINWTQFHFHVEKKKGSFRKCWGLSDTFFQSVKILWLWQEKQLQPSWFSVWKFLNFSATQIFREIKMGSCCHPNLARQLISRKIEWRQENSDISTLCDLDRVTMMWQFL